MQPNIYFIIFSEKMSKKFGPKSLKRPGPISARSKTAAPPPKPGPHAQKPGPGPGIQPPSRPATARAGADACQPSDQIRRPAPPPLPRRVKSSSAAPQTLSYFLPPLLSLLTRRRLRASETAMASAERRAPEGVEAPPSFARQRCVRPWPARSSVEHRSSVP